MSEEQKNVESQEEKVQKCHKYMGPTLFNLTWDYIDKGENRTPEDELMMIHATHASALHWRLNRDSKPENFARGEWQVSRVYALLGRAKESMYHAELCLEICKENGIGDWDIAFAYEACARAAMVAKAPDTMEKYLKLAREATALVKDKGDREMVEGDIESIKL
ncbi:MAG TPA: hypothetical protein PKV16_07565 [Caldisericia bacterium]|nr:hypothetical protein [Caldisericia bacterium]HPF49456.1 hypothetical protein [Caldisericia bacterium]HPI84674.1 hypothetical protein [Caldisericia bacterium]HPQ93625.1 hypothetical protein [Caldisericia bacterium]HRV75596.1 hypothetical protein [Caldisericia bacterium]